MLPYWAANLAILYPELNEQCYGRRIRMKTVGLVHSTFHDFINKRRGIQNTRSTAEGGCAHLSYLSYVNSSIDQGKHCVAAASLSRSVLCSSCNMRYHHSH